MFDPVFTQENINVGTSATELAPSGGAADARTHVLIENKGPETVYYGPDNSVTAAGANQGSILDPRQIAVLPLDSNLTVFAITASGTATVLIQELTCVDVENF